MGGAEEEEACGLICSAPGSPAQDVSDAAAVDLLSHSSVCAIQRGALLVFDWDDTLLPSSWLSKSGVRLDSPDPLPTDIQEQLAACDKASASLLQSAICCASKVFIITNAEEGWVSRSAARFAPILCRLLPLCSVLSARSSFEASAPGDFLQWKIMAFRKVIGEFPSFSSVLSIGDSLVERDAVYSAASSHPDIFVKSIKLIDKPTPLQLSEQLIMLRDSIHTLSHEPSHLDLMIQITPSY
jgi:hypothetical protein